MIEIPVGYRADTLKTFEQLLALPRPVLLHSADRTTPQGRYDVMSADPLQWISHADGRLHVNGMPQSVADPLQALRGLVATEPASGDHFRSGFIGYLGYGLRHGELRATDLPPDPTALPLLQGGIYGWSLVTDHLQRRSMLYGQRVGRAYLDQIRQRLDGVGVRDRACQAPALSLATPFETQPETAYRTAFAEIQAYLTAGDCYQVNLARHYRALRRAGPPTGTTDIAAWRLYRHLQALQPGAFSAFLDTPAGAVLSFSPERLLRFTPGRGAHPAVLQTCPIKGTAPRNTDPGADRAAADALSASTKNRAENLMIVDLLRNDLGRVCTPGSIQVTKLFELVSLRNVHHLVSTIEGRPRADADALSCIDALFPGGSITGAPKLRAMQIINELEPVGRSVYCGAIGYIDGSGLADFNVAIRTMVAEPHQLHCWGGGGIVAESDCASELEEIDNKIGRLLQAVGTNSALSSS